MERKRLCLGLIATAVLAVVFLPGCDSDSGGGSSCSPTICPGDARWVSLYPPLGGSTYYAMGGSSDDNIFVGGDRGSAARYDGSEWRSIDISTSNSVQDFWGTGPDNMYAVTGTRSIYHFDGSGWSIELLERDFYSVAIWGSSASDIWVVGSGYEIAHFDGTEWEYFGLGDYYNLYDVWGAAYNDIYTVGYNGVVFHYNGSAWSPMSSGTTEQLNAVWGSDDEHIYACGYSGTVRFCNGTSWSTVTDPVFGTNYMDAVGGRAWNDVYIMSYYYLYHFDGSSWTDIYNNVGSSQYCMYVGSAAVYTAGSSGYISAYDGADWELEVGGFPYFYDVWTQDKSTAVAVGRDGAIYHYSGGAWGDSSIATSSDFQGIDGTGSNLYAVGSGGMVYHYDGSSWSEVGHGQGSAGLYDVFVIGDHVFAAGNSGYVYHYDGSTWETFTPVVSVTLLSIHGTAVDDVYAVGNDGTAIYYNGTDWVEMDTGFEELDLEGVWASSSGNVFACGDNGLILKYDGSSWNTIGSDYYSRFNDVSGAGGDDVYFAGSGTVVHYDGSELMDMHQNLTWNTLYGIDCSSTANIFVVGYNGTVIQYRD